MEERLDPEAVIEEFESLSRDAERVQRETLQKILDENGGAEYLQRWGLNGRTDPATFKACVPIVTHSDLEPYIQRIADGTSPCALTGKPITTISLRCSFTLWQLILLIISEYIHLCVETWDEWILRLLQFWYNSREA